MEKMICKHSVSCSKHFTALEKVILGKMFDWEEWNKKNQSSDEETFIITNEAGLIELDAHVCQFSCCGILFSYSSICFIIEPTYSGGFRVPCSHFFRVDSGIPK